MSVVPPGSDDTSRAPRTAAATRILAESHAEFRAFIERRVGSRETAEDILQDAFVRAIDHAGSVRLEESLVAWFYRVLRNAITDHYRRKGAATRAAEALAVEVAADEPPEVWREEACRCVLRLAKSLKPDYAEILQRIEIDGMSVKAFAKERGITEGNAAVRVFRARQALRRQVALSCRTCADHGCLDCTCRDEPSGALEK